jgi:hypothetical protein
MYLAPIVLLNPIVLYSQNTRKITGHKHPVPTRSPGLSICIACYLAIIISSTKMEMGYRQIFLTIKQVL